MLRYLVTRRLSHRPQRQHVENTATTTLTQVANWPNLSRKSNLFRSAIVERGRIDRPGVDNTIFVRHYVYA